MFYQVTNGVQCSTLSVTEICKKVNLLYYLLTTTGCEKETLGDFTFWIISVLILEYKIIINLADEFRSYPVVRIDIRIIRKLN